MEVSINSHFFFINAPKLLIVHLELLKLVFSQRKESVFFAFTIYPKFIFGALIAWNDFSFNIFFKAFTLAPLIGNELKLANWGVQYDFFVVIVGSETDGQVEAFWGVVDIVIVEIVFLMHWQNINVPLSDQALYLLECKPSHD